MSEFLVKGKHFARNHIWFETVPDYQIDTNCDVIVIHGNPTPVSRIGKHSCKVELQRTGISDLTLSEEALFGLVSKSIRNHINRSKRENVEVHVYRTEAEIESILVAFAEMYHGMFLEKGMADRFLEVNDLRAYAKKNVLIVTTASINGEVVKFNAHIHNGTYARGLYGCSHFRTVDKETRNAIGRAGEYLDWMDLLYCKELGITEYDWGGLSSFENPNGIDKYKMKFGIEFREYYNITCYCSPRAKAYYWVKGLLGAK